MNRAQGRPRERQGARDEPLSLAPGERFERIRSALLAEPLCVCVERAALVTEHFRRWDQPSEPMVLRKAKALRHLLSHKSAIIHPDELIVGNAGKWRKSALLQPELAGVFMSGDLPWRRQRKTTPMRLAWRDRLTLATDVLPYWLPRNMVVRAFAHRRRDLLRYMFEQLDPTTYLINEAGGIGHFLPHYERMIRTGVRGYLDDMKWEQGPLHEAARIACEGLVAFANRLGDEAQRQASKHPESTRADELLEIARICRKVPEHPADTFHEALQSLWLTHLGVCLESINSAISFGRLDQILGPYYDRDRRAGRLTEARARELLLCFSAKTTEHVFVLSEKASQYHGGFLVAQAAIVGGVDEDGQDAVNDLTYVLLDVMQSAGLREPNYQARLHAGAPKEYVQRVVEVARSGRGVPAMFNDEAIVAALCRHGYSKREARAYGIVGCVEPAIPGASFLSTDAALVNLPMCLELALNQGRRWGTRRRIGARTPAPEMFSCTEDVYQAFRTQLTHVVSKLITDLHVIEEGNRHHHPTPLSSMLTDGCLESSRDVTAGGARHNGSGIQGVGVADVADSFAALEKVLFAGRRATMNDLRQALRDDFVGHTALLARLRAAPKFGNDDPLPDSYAARIVGEFNTALSQHMNTRNGHYVPGFYSSTTHVAFGKRTGALPSGRRAGEPFAASLSCALGGDRNGPTALLNSVAKVDGTLAPNGYALNLRFDPVTVSGERGLHVLSALVRGFFESGGMELQLNVLDPAVLEQARCNPGMHAGLVVRVAGYCAYFDDLPDSVKDEIICRTRLTVGSSK